ncbi:hypothetical protein A1D22_06865 [Pasteurellaceae bacterium LFhippo2]|nr:hypothetical protein [Pasteurellaceae bacterium LFhippo2]
MKKKHSRIGFIASIAMHSVVFASVYGIYHTLPPEQKTEEITSISMEMLAARLEQPQVATAPDADPSAMEEPEKVIEPEVQEPTPEPPPIAEPEPKPLPPPKPVEKPKPKEQPKPKEPPKPKEQPKPKEPPKPKEKVKELPKEDKAKDKPKVKSELPKDKPKGEIAKVGTKALEKGPEVKAGIVAKAVPNAVQGPKTQAGVPNGATNGEGKSVGSATGSSSANEIGAYQAQLQRALQQRATNAYPQRERMMRKTGVVTLSLSVSSSGQVVNVNVVNSSGNSNLDAAAVKAAQSTKLSASPPAGFPSSLVVPVRFSIQ